MDKDKLSKAIEDAAEDVTNGKIIAPKSADINYVDIALCNENVDNHHGCFCDFKEAGGKGSSIFMSNMDNSKTACLSINGKTEILTGQRTDEIHDHIRHSHVPDWIVLDPDGDVHIFNELVDDANYEANKKSIIETMHVMHDLPEKMKMRLNKDDDGKEVSAELKAKYEKMWTESIETVKAERADGKLGAPLEIELSNEVFDVHISGKPVKHNDDGSDNYTGTIVVKSKSGKKLGSKDFEGVCMCKE